MLTYALQYIFQQIINMGFVMKTTSFHMYYWLGELMVLLSVSQLLCWNVCLLMNINKLSPHLVSLAHSILNPLILSLPFSRHLITRLAATHWPFAVSLSHVYSPHTHTHTLTQIFSVRLWHQVFCAPSQYTLSIQTRPWKMFQSLCLLLLCFQRR